MEKSIESCSPLKLTRLKSMNGSLVTPTKKRSVGKSYYGGEDDENDASLAASSGKNSRRKTSVMRSQLYDSHSKARVSMDAPRKTDRTVNARYL